MLLCCCACVCVWQSVYLAVPLQRFKHKSFEETDAIRDRLEIPRFSSEVWVRRSRDETQAENAFG